MMRGTAYRLLFIPAAWTALVIVGMALTKIAEAVGRTTAYGMTLGGTAWWIGMVALQPVLWVRGVPLNRLFSVWIRAALPPLGLLVIVGESVRLLYAADIIETRIANIVPNLMLIPCTAIAAYQAWKGMRRELLAASPPFESPMPNAANHSPVSKDSHSR